MQYIRSKVLDVFLIICTLVLGLATPLLVIWNNQKVVRTCSLIWAQGIAWGIWHIVGLTYRLQGVLPTLATPKLIISNHQSMWETITYATLLRNVSFVAKKELARVPVFGWYLRKFPMVLIDRSSGRLAFNDLLNKASEAIAEGRSILIFPEGTRVQPDEYKKFHFGVAALYNRTPLFTGCRCVDGSVKAFAG